MIILHVAIVIIGNYTVQLL